MPTRSRHCKRGAVAPAEQGSGAFFGRHLAKKAPDPFFRRTRHCLPKGCGKTRAAAAIRKSGHLATGTSLFSGATDAEEGPMPVRFRASILVFLFSLSLTAPSHAQTTPAPSSAPITITESIVVT